MRSVFGSSRACAWNPAVIARALLVPDFPLSTTPQAWFRDPPAPKTTKLSSALEFTLGS